MNEILYRYLGNAADLSNLPFAVIFTVTTSFVISCLFLLIVRPATARTALIQVFVSFVVIFILHWVVYNSIRGQIHEYRVARIKSVMAAIHSTPNYPLKPSKPIQIDKWEKGLEAIRQYPAEAGYYLATVDLLERDHDYRSAMILLELGLDHFATPPLPICDRLQTYYRKLQLANRPAMSKCEKIIRIP